MPDLSVNYMGLKLRNPLIAGSSGLTATVDSLLELEDHGIGAVVLRSLFEEDLGSGPDNHVVHNYLELISEAKKKLSIPVIASINCVSSYEWTSFSKQIEGEGADGLELNLFVPPSDPMKDSSENEKVYFDILTDVRRQVKFPLAVKISPHFSGMTRMALKLSWTGINGLVLFNRFFQPDIDVDKLEIVRGQLLSSPGELNLPLRWVGLLSDRVMCDIAGSTGVHDYQAIVKYLLAGAKAVQAASVFYEKGPEYAEILLKGLSDWMIQKGFESPAAFTGKLSLKKAENPADYDRYQYLRAFHP